MRPATVFALAALFAVGGSPRACSRGSSQGGTGNTAGSMSGSSVAAPSSSALGPGSGSAAASSEPAPEPIGGPWAHCYARFRPTSTPARDVTRLATLCGPENGQRAVGDVEQGTLAATDQVKEHSVTLKAGECLRVFAVGAPSIGDLEVSVVSAGGEVIAKGPAGGRWRVAPIDRAACVSEDGTYTARVASRHGTGDYAIQTWRLP